MSPNIYHTAYISSDNADCLEEFWKIATGNKNKIFSFRKLFPPPKDDIDIFKWCEKNWDMGRVNELTTQHYNKRENVASSYIKLEYISKYYDTRKFWLHVTKEYLVKVADHYTDEEGEGETVYDNGEIKYERCSESEEERQIRLLKTIGVVL